MAIYKRDIVDINLETGNIHRSFLNHTIGYKDQQADHFGIRTFRNGEPVDLTGVSVQGVFMPPQGSPIAITSGNIVDGNVAEVVLPQACYNYDGNFTLAIKLVDGTNSITGTMRIVDGVVDNTHASGTVAPTSAVPTYQEVLATYDDMVEALADYQEMVDEQNEQISDLKSALSSDINGFTFETANDKYTSGKYHNVDYRVTGNTVVLNGTANGGFRLKLSGASAAISNKIEDSWKSESIGLVTGHKYMLCVEYVSGTGDRAGIGVNGSSGETIWLWVDPSTATPNNKFYSVVFTASATNSSFIYVYTTTSKSHSNLTFRFNVIDITASEDLLRNKFNLAENGMEDVKNYVFGRESSLGAVDVITGSGVYTYESLNVSIRGNQIKLDGTNSTSVRIKLTNTIEVSHDWDSGWQSESMPVFNENHKYAIALTCISGSGGTAISRASLADDDGNVKASAYITNADGYAKGVKYSEAVDGLSDVCCLYLYIAGGGSFTDVVLQLNLVDLTIMEQLVDSSEDVKLHDYYFADDYINERINTIIDLRASASINNESFVWFTDPHYYRPSTSTPENGMQSAQIIEYMKEQVNTRMVICGGDMLRGTLTKAVCRAYFKKTRGYLNPIYDDLFMAIGNHEYNNTGSNSENELDSPELYAMFVKNQEERFDSISGKGDYTFQNKAQKVRYFVIGCTRIGGLFSETVSWLADEITKVEDGYHVIIISHIGMKTDGSHEIMDAFVPVCQIIDAVNARGTFTYNDVTYNYNNVNCEIVCALTGHTHYDGYALTDGGTPIIETMSDKSFTDSGSDAAIKEIRKIGTIGEQSVNYVLIDFENHKIHMIRLGGSAIGASYDSQTGKVYDTEAGTGTEYTGTEWVLYSPYKDQHFDYTGHLT